MEIKKKKIEKTIYIASDGTEFDSQWSCESYEEELETERQFHSADSLIVDTDCTYNWPLITDMVKESYPREPWKHYHWYKISNDDDLHVFLHALEAEKGRNTPDFQSFRMRLRYPDYICVAECQEVELFILSELTRHMSAFLSLFGDPHILQRGQQEQFYPQFEFDLEDVQVFRIFMKDEDKYILFGNRYEQVDEKTWSIRNIGREMKLSHFISILSMPGEAEGIFNHQGSPISVTTEVAIKMAQREGEKGGMVFKCDLEFLAGIGDNAEYVLEPGWYVSHLYP